jgi:hypothetical protein
VTVTAVVPAMAAEFAVSVKMLVVAVLAGLNEAVTPAGRLDAVRTTLPEKPAFWVTVMVFVAGVPDTTLTVVTDGFSVNAAAGVTVSATPAVTLSAPEVAVMVTLLLLPAALALAVKVKVLALDTTGLKDAVTPEGSPVAATLTVPVKPLVGVMVTTTEPLVPAPTVNEAADVFTV